MYHALQDPPSGCSHAKYRKYKWLDYRKLSQSVIGSNDSIERIAYFTAYAKWKRKNKVRHMTYIKALRSVGVDVVMGRFKKRYKTCHLCNRTFLTHEEKRTDVNIALNIVTDAVEDAYDKAVLVSADSDLLPIIETIHHLTPDKEVGVMFPIGRAVEDLRRNTDFIRKMPEDLLRRCQFPDVVKVGKTLIEKPKSWFS